GHTDKVSHVNVYTTDKAVTYQLHHGSFSAHSPTDLYPQKIGNLVKDVDKMAMMFFDCTQGSVQDGAARFEVRVQVWRAHEALPEFDEEDLRNCIVCLPSQVWWDMKYIRTVALKLVFQQMESEPPAARVNLGSLTLGIMSIILLNALISRPQDWAAQRDLSVACLMR
ncbi:hypothetical protein K466DRAFT_467591, partial [Polyporus arcularius HHB13444]